MPSSHHSICLPHAIAYDSLTPQHMPSPHGSISLLRSLSISPSILSTNSIHFSSGRSTPVEVDIWSLYFSVSFHLLCPHVSLLVTGIYYVSLISFAVIAVISAQAIVTLLNPSLILLLPSLSFIRIWFISFVFVSLSVVICSHCSALCRSDIPSYSPGHLSY